MDLQRELERLLAHPERSQDFLDLFSDDSRWRTINPNTSVPKGTGFWEGECPECWEALRVIYPSMGATEYTRWTCPHCNECLGVSLEDSGWTRQLTLQDYEPERHGGSNV